MSKKKTSNNIDPTYSEEEQNILTAGDEAEELLRNGLVEATFQAFVNTAPEDAEGREKSYHHYRALVDIIHTLQQRVNVRNQVLEKADNDNSGE